MNEYTLSKSLNSATAHRSPHHGAAVHAAITKLGFTRFTILITALIHHHLTLSHLADAHRLFDELPYRDVVAWTAMIAGHARRDRPRHSLSLFRRMLASRTAPNSFTLSAALTACSRLGAIAQGKQIHAQLLTTRTDYPLDPVLNNGLLDMYSRCRSLKSAQKVFDGMPVKTIVTWNEMMSCNLQLGQPESCLRLLASMVSDGSARPDGFSYSICADACAAMASMLQGTMIHACILRDGFRSDLVIRNVLVDMYAKCGCADSSKKVFDEMPSSDPVLWTAMISALGKCGRARGAIAMFERMVELEIKCDEIAYLVVLSACSHGGLLSEGWHYFNSMPGNVPAKAEHYGCMVDLLCRSGLLNEALAFIKQMPLEPSVAVWSAFLCACRMRGNAELGRIAASRLRELDPGGDDGIQVVLSGVHVMEEEWDKSWRIRESMRDEKLKKEPGCSWIQVNDGIHVFLATDTSQQDVILMLNDLNIFLQNNEL